MARLFLVSLPLLGALLSSGPALAIEWWHDPEIGCGTLEGWKKTRRMADLPGCDGQLPKGAPAGEIAMHDAKKLLREIEKQIDSEKTGEVEAKLTQAIEIMNKAPKDPRVDWARMQFSIAYSVIKAKAALAPKLRKLRTSFKAVSDVTGQPKSEAQQKALTAAMDACVQGFKEAETAGVDLSLPIELTAGKLRPLRDDLQECEQAKSKGAESATAATPTTEPAKTTTEPAKTTTEPAKATAKGGSDGDVPRAKWVKGLRGDRKKVFENHENAFPEYEGDPGPKGAAKAAEWRYGSEVFKFKRNKLLKEKSK